MDPPPRTRSKADVEAAGMSSTRDSKGGGSSLPRLLLSQRHACTQTPCSYYV